MVRRLLSRVLMAVTSAGYGVAASPSISSAAREIASQLESNQELFAAVQHQLQERLPVSIVHDQDNNLHNQLRRRLGGEFHSIFELTCHPGQKLGSHCAYWDWMFFGFWLVLLIVVTILVETLMHKLEQFTKYASKLGHHIYQKMIRELALLGFVSWFAILFANIDGLGPWLKAGSAFRFLMLEFAHVMIFVMAIMFCFMIALVYSTIRSIERTWDRIEDPEQRMHEKDFDPWEPPMEALKCLEGLIADKLHQREHSGVFSWFARSNSSSTDLVANGSSSREEAVASADALSPPPSPPADAEKARPPPRLAWDWLHCRCKRDVEMRRAWRAAHHFVLMYEFKRAHRLSNVKSFVYANYLSKSLRVHIIDILEPSHQTWGLLSIIGFISFLVPDLAYRMAKGHPNAFDGAFSQDAAIAAKADPLDSPFEPQSIHFFMHLGWVALNWLVALASVWVSLRARRMYFRQVAKIFKPYAHSWVVFFEAKCPTTASAVAQLPIEQRTIFYLLYGFIATKGQGPLGTIKAEGTKAVDLASSAGAEASANHDQAVQGAAGAGGKVAVDHVDNDIIGDIEQEKEQEGDYQSAMVMQENKLLRSVLDVNSAHKVRERVASLLRLAELTWRFSAYHPGENPLEKTKRLLEEAEAGLRTFIDAYDRRGPNAEESSSKCLKLANSDSVDSEESSFSKARAGPASWAYRSRHVDFRLEVGKIKQYHAAVRMRHNPKTLDEFELITKFLDDAKTIFTNKGAHSDLCNTLNSIGMLKQSRKLYADASDYFKRVIEIRTDKLPTDRAGLAQAFVSLGTNLLKDQPPVEKAQQRYQYALPLLEEALAHYLAAFHAQHPKVAWGHAAIADACGKLKDYERAQHHLDLAYAIRSKMGDERGLLELKCLGEGLQRQMAAEDNESFSKSSIKLWKRTRRHVLVAGSDGRGGATEAVSSSLSDQPERAADLACVARVLSGRIQHRSGTETSSLKALVASASNANGEGTSSFFGLVLAARKATEEAEKAEQEAKEIAQREEADEPAAGSSGRMSDSKITAPVTTDDVEMAVPTAQA